MTDSGLVVLGGILSSAQKAYEQIEQTRLAEVTSIKTEVQAVNQKIDEVKKRRMLRIDLKDLNGAWYNSSDADIIVNDGKGYFNGGPPTDIVSQNGTLCVNGWELDQESSSAYELVWKKSNQNSITWTRLLGTGGREVTLTLLIGDFIHTNQLYFEGSAAGNGSAYEFPFSLVGCNVKLQFRAGSEGTDCYVGCYFGLVKTNPQGNANRIDAIRCRVKIWIGSDRGWKVLATITRRFPAGEMWGSRKAIGVAEFLQYINGSQGVHDKSIKVCVSVTEIQMLELSSDQPLRGQLVR